MILTSLHNRVPLQANLQEDGARTARIGIGLHSLHAGSPGQAKDEMSWSRAHRCCSMPCAGQGCTLRPWSSDSCPILAACTASYSCLRLCISFSSASLSPCITSPAMHNTSSPTISFLHCCSVMHTTYCCIAIYEFRLIYALSRGGSRSNDRLLCMGATVKCFDLTWSEFHPLKAHT